MTSTPHSATFDLYLTELSHMATALGFTQHQCACVIVSFSCMYIAVVGMYTFNPREACYNSTVVVSYHRGGCLADHKQWILLLSKADRRATEAAKVHHSYVNMHI